MTYSDLGSELMGSDLMERASAHHTRREHTSGLYDVRSGAHVAHPLERCPGSNWDSWPAKGPQNRFRYLTPVLPLQPATSEPFTQAAHMLADKTGLATKAPQFIMTNG
jgi:hypothetical protein